MTERPTLFALVVAGRERLLRAGVSPDTSAIDAEVLARHALGWDRARYLERRLDAPPPGFVEQYEGLMARREAREPVSQILGRREFYGREFTVTSDVLTPRPETELIVEAALSRWGAGTSGPRRAADAGTGSGCLAITLACEWPGSRVVATDISGAALRIADVNRRRLGVASRVPLVRADLVQPVAPPLDLIVSNPPYVPEPARAVLPREVRDYEPAAALYGGTTGHEIIERLLDQCAAALAPDGWLVMEFGAGQDDVIDRLVGARPALRVIDIREDLQAIPRVAVIGRR